LLFGPDAHAAPGIGQVRRGLLVVGQPGPGDRGHGRGHALVVDLKLDGREAMLAGPLIPIAQPQGLRQ
jgi:hypothetical protein